MSICQSLARYFAFLIPSWHRASSEGVIFFITFPYFPGVENTAEKLMLPPGTGRLHESGDVLRTRSQNASKFNYWGGQCVNAVR
jgi:hypothetical protein